METITEERQLYATDGELFLYPISEVDRENFVHLQVQTKGKSTLFLNPYFKDKIWNQVLYGKNKIFSIYNKQGIYYGSTELMHLPSKTPEIGIALLENYRNKGFALKILQLLMKQTCKEQEVDYFLARISSRNPHSKHVCEKIGGIFIREEVNTSNPYEEEEIIYQYILLPELCIQSLPNEIRENVR